MNVHKNTRLTLHRRAELARRVLVEGQSAKAVAATAAFGVDAKTVAKWVGRFKAECQVGLADRSLRPHKLHRPTAPETVAQIIALRRQRFAGLSRAKDLDPPEPVVRYERKRPGELIHLDIKKLGRFEKPGHRVTGDRTSQSNGRGVGWEYVHVCIDNASRFACSQIMPDEKGPSAVAALKAAVAYYKSLGVTISRVMSDNGACYKSHAFRDTCAELGLKHIRTKPYTPKTNGKAERFIQTALREWAYAKVYSTSDHRTAELPGWLHRYNWQRPHGGTKSQTPISRLGLDQDNLLRLHI